MLCFLDLFPILDCNSLKGKRKKNLNDKLIFNETMSRICHVEKFYITFIMQQDLINHF